MIMDALVIAAGLAAVVAWVLFMGFVAVGLGVWKDVKKHDRRSRW